jgi:hypothetical protein
MGGGAFVLLFRPKGGAMFLLFCPTPGHLHKKNENLPMPGGCPGGGGGWGGGGGGIVTAGID